MATAIRPGVQSIVAALALLCGLAVSSAAEARQPDHEASGDIEMVVETLAFGCRDHRRGPAFVGWCQHRTFYGPLYLGGVAFTYDRKLTVVGVGQVGVINVARKYRGFLRVGAVNVADDATAADVSAVSHVDDDFAGAQLAALVAAAGDDMDGVQLAAGYAYANEMTGIQGALVARTDDRAEGWQFGVVTYAEDMRGLQLGAVNVVEQWTTAQAGAVNYGGKRLEGLQLGVVNTVGTSEGVQIGLFNYARKLNGLQIGLFNIAVDDGLPFMMIANAGW